MKLSTAKLKALSRARGTNLAGLLARAGVSRNAYYSLARKASVVPDSIQRIARELNVPPSRLLEDPASPEQQALRLAKDVRRIVRRHPEADPDNIRHTLLLLREPPITRLRRALQRGRKLSLR